MTLRFQDERYVRIYTRQTVTWNRLGWAGRVVMHETFLHMNRIGLLSLSGESPVDAVCAVTGMPQDIVELGLAVAIQRGCLVHVDADEGYLLAPRFMEAQEARQSNAMRMRARRERVRERKKLVKSAQRTGDPLLVELVARLEKSEKEMDFDNSQSDPEDFASNPTQKRSDETAERSGNVVPLQFVTDATTENTPSSESERIRHKETKVDTPSRTVPYRTDHERESVARAHASNFCTTQPDNSFLEDTEIHHRDFQPAEWLLKEAHTHGLSESDVADALRCYHDASEMGMATPAKHAKAFAKWLKRAAKTKVEGKSSTGGRREESNRRGGNNRVRSEASDGAPPRASGPPPITGSGSSRTGPKHRAAVEATLRRFNEKRARKRDGSSGT